MVVPQLQGSISKIIFLTLSIPKIASQWSSQRDQGLNLVPIVIQSNSCITCPMKALLILLYWERILW